MLPMKQSDDKRRLIIGAPLMLIVVFCFGFFLMHPGGGVSHAAISDTSDSKSAPAKANNSVPASQPQNLPAAEPAQAAPSSPAASSESTTSKADNDNQGTDNHGTNNSTTTSNSSGQGGMIQTVFNGLLNGH